MRLRFKTQYSGLDTLQRIAYETVSDEPEFNERWCPCYRLKLLGLIPCKFLEPAEGNELEAIDILIEAKKN